MKPLVFILLGIWVASPVQAQTEKDTLYGFREHISPGIKKAGDIDENGKLVKETSPGITRYIIYLSTASKDGYEPLQLWINGEAFSIRVDTLSQPPAKHSNIIAPGAKPKYLFPESKGSIYRLTPITLPKIEQLGKSKSLVDQNAAVLYYRKNGTEQYVILKKFTDMEGAALQ